jgi:hypothetical protein
MPRAYLKDKKVRSGSPSLHWVRKQRCTKCGHPFSHQKWKAYHKGVGGKGSARRQAHQVCTVPRLLALKSPSKELVKKPRIRTKAALAKKRLMILELENTTNAKDDNEDKGDDSSTS